MTGLRGRRPRGRPPHPDVLTPAEWRVLEELRGGAPNAEIARRLGVTPNTVKTHVSNMLAKLGMRRREELAAWTGSPAPASRRRLRRMRKFGGLPVLSGSRIAAGLAGKGLVVGGTIAAVAIVTLIPLAIAQTREPSPAVGGVASTPGRMTEPRWAHTATLLQDGTVLIVGGYGEPTTSGGAVALASAELYNPATGSFTPVGSMSGPHAGHTATLLHDGTVLIVGGDYRAELYDPATRAFTPLGYAHRTGHAAVLLADGSVLLVSGSGDGLTGSTTAIFDPADRTFHDAGTLKNGGAGVTATVLEDGRVLITGGCCTSAHGPVDAVQIYDPATGTSRLLDTTLRDGSMVHSAVRLADGRVWISTGDIFDPATESVHHVGDVEAGRMPVVLLDDGTVWMPGGFVDNDEGVVQTSQRFDPATDSLTDGPVLEEIRQYQTATVLDDGSVLITGGTPDADYAGSTHPLDSAELYRPVSATRPEGK